MTARRKKSSYRIPRKKPRRISRETRVFFVLSTVLHALLLVLIGISNAQQNYNDIKLTEISYIEERYGAEVARKVTVAPEKLPAVKADKPVKREGSIFAKAKPTKRMQPDPILAADISNTPLPKPLAPRSPSPFQTKQLQSRNRSARNSIVPQVRSDQVLLSSGLTDSPRLTRMASEEVDLTGKMLVGRKAHQLRSAVYEIEEEDGSLAASNMTLALPSGGIDGGHPDLIGGTLAEGKEAYLGQLPAGNLVARTGRDKLTALADIDVITPSGTSDGSVLGTALIEPTAGKGLVSRGGSDAISRGTMQPRPALQSKSSEPLTRKLTPPSPKRDEVAPAKDDKQSEESKGVTMTLSGPILGREVLSSSSPSYPEEAKRRGWQGNVSIYFIVRPDGTIKKTLIEKASTHQVLDEAARRCLRDWRFSPLESAAEQWGVLTIVFRLR